VNSQHQHDVESPAVAAAVACPQKESAHGDSAGHFRPAALKAYARQTHETRQNELVVQYLPLVHKVVHQVASYLRPPLSREDLVSAGTIGLVKAARDFDPSQAAEFKTYAYIRIRGAVIDELRGWSFAPAKLKKQYDRARQILAEMTERTGRTPTDEELAEQLGISTDKLYRMFENARVRHFLSIHSLNDQTPALGKVLAAADTSHPGERIEKAELLEQLAAAIAALPQRQRRIIILYYAKELTMKQIAEVLNVTESRISQLHAAALFRLSVKLRQFDDSRE